MIKLILLVIFLALLGVVVFAVFKTPTFRVQREIQIKADAGEIFSKINDFHQWGAWSPFEKLDSAMKKNFSGAPTGVGAVYAWTGNSKAGAGRMEIVETAADSKVKIKLDFTQPMKTTNMIEFTLEPKDEFTKVTWAMYGTYPWIGKIMSVFMSMDKIVGKDFEAGLMSLKKIAEK